MSAAPALLNIHQINAAHQSAHEADHIAVEVRVVLALFVIGRLRAYFGSGDVQDFVSAYSCHAYSSTSGKPATLVSRLSAPASADAAATTAQLTSVIRAVVPMVGNCGLCYGFDGADTCRLEPFLCFFTHK